MCKEGFIKRKPAHKRRHSFKSSGMANTNQIHKYSYLCEQDGEHVLPLEADGQVDQREAHIKRRGPVKELHLVSSELPGDVATG